MIRLARINIAMPGKSFEVMAALKETGEIVKSVTGVEVMTCGSMGSHVGEFVSVSNYTSLADFEEKATSGVTSFGHQRVESGCDLHMSFVRQGRSLRSVAPRLESTYCCRSGSWPWTPQMGG